MIDEIAVAAQLEATAVAHGLPELGQTTRFMTAQGNQAMANVTVFVVAAEPGPAVDDVFENVAVGVETPLDVLANDPNPERRVITSVSPPAGATVTISADRKTLMFTGTAAGEYTFTYESAEE